MTLIVGDDPEENESQNIWEVPETFRVVYFE